MYPRTYKETTRVYMVVIPRHTTRYILLCGWFKYAALWYSLLLSCPHYICGFFYKIIKTSYIAEWFNVNRVREGNQILHSKHNKILKFWLFMIKGTNCGMHNHRWLLWSPGYSYPGAWTFVVAFCRIVKTSYSYIYRWSMLLEWIN